MSIPIVFLILSCAFVFSLFKSLWDLLHQDFKDAENMGMKILKIFKWPILSFVGIMIFVMVILPRMQ